ncbi:MAG: type II toxin-antitoxin system VapC family toxin [Verrucomicrobiota bacterium]
MKVILDTHALVWAAEDNSRLGKAARDALTGLVREDIGISALSLLELAMLVSKGRLRVSDDDGIKAIESLAARVTVIPLDAATAWEAMALRLPQSDPFDRVIVATAKRLGLPLVTKDRLIRKARLVPTIW